MIPHHEGAVVMANEALQKSKKKHGIKALGESIIRSQEAEINQMREWERVWNG